MNRRSFLTSALVASGGLLVPEWLLDPPKGRSMVSVPGLDFLEFENLPMAEAFARIREGLVGDIAGLELLFGLAGVEAEMKP